MNRIKPNFTSTNLLKILGVTTWFVIIAFVFSSCSYFGFSDAPEAQNTGKSAFSSPHGSADQNSANYDSANYGGDLNSDEQVLDLASRASLGNNQVQQANAVVELAWKVPEEEVEGFIINFALEEDGLGKNTTSEFVKLNISELSQESDASETLFYKYRVTIPSYISQRGNQLFFTISSFRADLTSPPSTPFKVMLTEPEAADKDYNINSAQ